MHKPWSEQVLGSNSRPACQRGCDFGQAVSLFLLQNDVPKVVERTQRSQYLQSAQPGAWHMANTQGTQLSSISPQTTDTWAHTTVVCACGLRALTDTALGCWQGCISAERMAFPSKAKEMVSLY